MSHGVKLKSLKASIANSRRIDVKEKMITLRKIFEDKAASLTLRR